MENDTNVHRAVTWFLFKEGATATEILQRLQNVCSECAPSRATVFRWFDGFRGGKNTITDEKKSGRPKTASTRENLEKVANLIKEDPRITIGKLSDELAIGRNAIESILHDELHLVKMSAHWIPKLLTCEQKTARQETCSILLKRFNQEGPNFLERIVTGDESWVNYYEPESKQQSKEWRVMGSPPPLKPRTTISALKRMVSFFWDNQGPLLIKWLPGGRTVNSQYYIEVMRELREEIKNSRRGKLTKGILHLHDNARPHTSQETLAIIRDLHFEILPHPPYSPDLAPSDYWIFGALKKPLKGRRFESLQQLATSVSKWSRDMPVEWYREGISKLPERWARCIQMKWKYVEVENK